MLTRLSPEYVSTPVGGDAEFPEFPRQLQRNSVTEIWVAWERMRGKSFFTIYFRSGNDGKHWNLSLRPVAWPQMEASPEQNFLLLRGFRV